MSQEEGSPLTSIQAFAPTQAAEFSGPGKHAVVVYAPEWADLLFQVLQQKPGAYEAAWAFQEDRRAHVLEVAYEGGPTLHVALIDGIHNQLFAKLARGCALVLSPHRLYREPGDPEDTPLFDPEQSVALPELPDPLA